MIKGVPVTLYTRVFSHYNEINEPIYTELPIEVKNVLIEPLTSDDIINNETIYGKKGVYRLCIPKGDAHRWEDCKVEFFGATWRVFGFAQEYIEELLPLSWNKKVMVDRYE